MTHATDENFDSVIKNKLVLVDFYATWCGPCSMQTEVLEKLKSSRVEQNYEIVKVNVDENRMLTSKYNIESIPTIIVFKDGKKVKEHVGYMELEEINSMMEEYK